MIVVATDDFALYHEVVRELRDRGVAFTTVSPGDPLPERTRVVVTARSDPPPTTGGGGGGGGGGEGTDGPDVAHVVAEAGEARRVVEDALASLRGGEGRTVVGVDPGTRPGIAVLVGDVVVAAFHVPLSDAVAVVRREVADAADPLVRVGDGARLQGASIVNDLDDVPVELVDETGTTPSLGTGARGMGDVLAAVNIARIEGERVDSRAVDPTAGELQRIKDESRDRSNGDRTIDAELARRVAVGELTVDEALTEHRERDGDVAGDLDDAHEDDGEDAGGAETDD